MGGGRSGIWVLVVHGDLTTSANRVLLVPQTRNQAWHRVLNVMAILSQQSAFPPVSLHVNGKSSE